MQKTTTGAMLSFTKPWKRRSQKTAPPKPQQNQPLHKMKKGAPKKRMNEMPESPEKPPPKRGPSLTPSTKFGPSRGTPMLNRAPGSKFGSRVSSGPAPRGSLYESRSTSPQSNPSLTPRSKFGGEVSAGPAPKNSLY